MTDQEKKVLWDYLISIQKNVDKILEEIGDDNRKIQEQYRELMLGISGLTTEVKVALESLSKATKIVKKENEETRKTFENGIADIEENLEGKTKIIVKEVKSKKWQFWKRNKK